MLSKKTNWEYKSFGEVRSLDSRTQQLRSSAISKSTRKSQTPGTEQKSAARQKKRRKTQIQMLQRIMEIVQHTYDSKE
jgi:hypothetical protein